MRNTTTLPRLSSIVLTSLASLAAGSTVPSAHATFTGITVTAAAGPSSTPVGATTIYRMWANFDSASDYGFSVQNFRFISATGFTGFVHNDNFTGGAYSTSSGSWYTYQSNNAFGSTDSWVSLTEPTSFPVSSAIPTGSWYPGDFFSNPQIPGILGAGVTWAADPAGLYFPISGQLLLGQFVISSSAQICVAADIAWGNTASGYGFTAVNFDFNANCVPAPGAIALLALAGLVHRRKR